MSHSSALFNRVPIDLPNKSGFNLDHENLFTATCGTLIPALCHPLLPNDTISLGVNFQVQLPPMVTDFYGKVDAVYESFFVPYRLLWGGWKDFITHPSSNPVYPSGTPYQRKPSRVPVLSFTDLNVTAASLADYLGLSVPSYDELPTGLNLNVLPFIAYHMIWDHWYRDSRIQSPAFFPPAAGSPVGGPAVLPHISVVSSTNLNAPSYNGSSTLADGTRLDALRQRNWSKGYFTSASPYPQGGQPSEVQFDVADNTGAFTIASLRSANSLQRWKERNNFSYEYGDQIYLQFGIYPKSEVIDKPIYLGRVVQPVYSRSVMQTAPGSEGNINDVVGSKKASTQVVGEGRLVDKFTASEHGFLFTMFSLRPHGYYSTGANRFFFELQSEDFPFPLLAGMGDQAIYTSELNGFTIDGRGDIFGYTDLYAHYKYIEDQVHGLLRDGETLENYALQRSFADEVELSSDFLEIPIDALDQVQAVGTSDQGFSCWVDTFFKFSKVSTLPAYSLPTLGDLKNTHKGSASRGGSRL